MANNLFRCEAKDSHGDVYLYGIIGSAFDGVSAREGNDSIKALGDVETLKIRVNSRGGDFDDGLAIRSMLMDHSASVSVAIDSIAASAATVAIAIPDIDITMAKGGRYMIHEPYSGIVGRADEMRKRADVLDGVRDEMVSIYTTRSNLPESQIAEMMAAETWMHGEQAVEHGFVTSSSDSVAVAACIDDEALKQFRHIPDDILKSLSVEHAMAEGPISRCVDCGEVCQDCECEREGITYTPPSDLRPLALQAEIAIERAAADQY